jgi:hypothetical protein
MKERRASEPLLDPREHLAGGTGGNRLVRVQRDSALRECVAEQEAGTAKYYEVNNNCAAYRDGRKNRRPDPSFRAVMVSWIDCRSSPQESPFTPPLAR